MDADEENNLLVDEEGEEIITLFDIFASDWDLFVYFEEIYAATQNYPQYADIEIEENE